MMDQLDIHNSKKRIEYAKTALHLKFSAENANTACEFLDRLRIENRSLGRIANCRVTGFMSAFVDRDNVL